MTDFKEINKIQVSITSLKNELGKVNSLDQVDNIYEQIGKHENSILQERKKDSADLQAKKAALEKKKELLTKQLEEVNVKLKGLQFKIDAHISIYVDQLTKRISTLETEIETRKEKIKNEKGI